MPDSLKLPEMLCSVVRLVSGKRFAGFRRSVIDELVAFAFGHAIRRRCHSAAGSLPGFSAVAGALDNLSEPAAGLRCINPVRISGRSFEVVHLPACKVGAADLPLFALAIRGKNECTLACTNQNSYLAHHWLLTELCTSCL